MGKILGFDISENNTLDLTDFKTMKEEGAEFIIIRSSYGWSYEDEDFRRHCELADEVGLRKMAYHYSYAKNLETAKYEAERCRKVIESAGVGLEMVFYDLEEPSLIGWATEAAEVFMKELGLNCGIYANLHWMENYIDWARLNCPIWVAQYNSRCDLKGYIWQFTDAYRIRGKYVDGNYMFLPGDDGEDE